MQRQPAASLILMSYLNPLLNYGYEGGSRGTRPRPGV